MKYLPVFICLLIFLTSQVTAQHCPFDGGSLIVVHLTDEQGKEMTNISSDLTLVEIDNPEAKSCTYAEGLLTKNFLPTKQTLQTKYQRYWENWIEPEYKDWILLNAGYYAVGLNMAEETCMIKKDGDFSYKKRQFEIRYPANGLQEIVKVDKKKIYSLCTDGGKWTRIVPIEIKLKTRKMS